MSKNVNPDTEQANHSANQVPCWNQDAPAAQLKEMFVDIVQQRRIALGQSPALRPVFLKPHGVAYGTFEPVADLPDDLKVGVFGMGKLDTWVRFSSDTTPSSPDLKTTCGIGIKLFGVEGEKLLGDGNTQDFILQNHDVFFVNTAQDMAEFTTAGVIDHDYDAYIDRHPKTKRILAEMAKPVASCLTTDYWSVLPYAFGPGRHVKYKLVPVDQPEGTPFNANNYLAIDLAQRLGQRPAQFKFMVQFRTDPATMPLDEATVRWSEVESQPIHIATLHLPQQDIHYSGQAQYGENLSYNPWHSLAVHEPQGSISLARKTVYLASSENRHNANGLPTQEPAHARCPFSQAVRATTDNDCIVSAAIYPPIGVCRMGNSPDEYFIGPEVTEPQAMPNGFYRDASGALKRQAARFRIYGLNAKGVPVKELTAENAKIEWHAHIANQKSSWYEFQLALDIPEAESAPPSLLRNATVSDRKALTIDPGPASISGCNTRGDALSGVFMDRSVYLGEMRTDDKGRLIMLGGHGKSASYDGSVAVTFANNEGWHDDTSDGPVNADVEYLGVKLNVQPAWVITAPPDYAPMQKSVRTMWDLMRDTAITAGMLPRPAAPSFTHDILPIFQRMSNLEWVNAGFAAAFGFNGPFNFSTPEWLRRLSDPTPANREMRKVLANNFRHFEVDSWSPVPWPWLYGDAMNIPSAHTPRQYTELTPTQLTFLDQWAAGEFIADYNPEQAPIRTLDEVPEPLQPDMLTRAAMEFCLADAFHPGCEMTWPMRQSGLYQTAYRLKPAPAGWQEPNYGPQLNSDVTTLPSGPIQGGQLPGSITRWMAVPWQTDTASCRSGYEPTYDPYVPTFWPARVPNQVMSEEQYQIVTNPALETGLRLQAFANRANWLEPLGLDQSYTEQINHMIHHFDEMGVVEFRPGVTGDPQFPTVMQVEHQKPDMHSGAADALQARNNGKTATGKTRKQAGGLAGAHRITDLSNIDKVRRFRN